MPTSISNTTARWLTLTGNRWEAERPERHASEREYSLPYEFDANSLCHEPFHAILLPSIHKYPFGMANQKITKYIVNSRATGQHDQAIRSTLLAAGWLPEVIEEGFRELIQPPLAPRLGVSSVAQESATTSTSGRPPELSLEQKRAINSWSSGALVPLFYSGSMRLWKLLTLEMAIFLAPAWLPLMGVLSERIFQGSFAGGFLFGLAVMLAGSLVLLPIRIVVSKRMAWKARKWSGFHEFLTVQKRWDVAGRVVFYVYTIPLIAALGITLVSLSASKRSTKPSTGYGISRPTPSPSLMNEDINITGAGYFVPLPEKGIHQISIKYEGSSGGIDRLVVADLLDTSCAERVLSLPSDDLYLCGGSQYVFTRDDSHTTGLPGLSLHIIGGPVSSSQAGAAGSGNRL